jgi:hypothetical protein
VSSALCARKSHNQYALLHTPGSTFAAVLWGAVTGGVKAFSYLTDNPLFALSMTLAWNGVLIAFYAVGGASAVVTFITVLCTLRTQISQSIRNFINTLQCIWLLPLDKLFRRPAVLPYAAYWTLMHSMSVLAVLLIYFEQSSGFCVVRGATALVTFICVLCTLRTRISRAMCNFTPHTTLYTTHTHCTLHNTHTLHFTPHTHCTLHNTHTALYTTHTLHFTQHTHCTLHNTHTALYTTRTALYTTHTALYTTHTLQYELSASGVGSVAIPFVVYTALSRDR